MLRFGGNPLISNYRLQMGQLGQVKPTAYCVMSGWVCLALTFAGNCTLLPGSMQNAMTHLLH